MKTAKIRRAVGFELSCPECGPNAEVEGPDGMCSLVCEHEFSVGSREAYCLECHSHLLMPKIPRMVNTYRKEAN